MMNDLRKNAEGYNDPTPYNAIKNVETENKVNAGEIWECTAGYNELKMFLVLKVFKRVALVLALNDEMKCEDDIEVICKGIRFTTPYMISYKFEKGFVSYVKSMKEDEFATLLDVVGGSLGFEATVPATSGNPMVNDLKEMYENERKICDSLQKDLVVKTNELEQSRKQNLELLDEVARYQNEGLKQYDDICKELEAERDKYKRWFESLFEKSIAG